MADAPTRRLRWHWPVLGAGLLIIALALYYVEWVEITTRQGPSAEALTNPYLAADRYLSRIGVNVERGTRLGDVAATLEDDDALVMTTSRATLDEATIDRLLGWVGRGGHLVALALNEYDPELETSNDPLLDRLGIQLAIAEDVDDEAEGEVVAEGEVINENLENVLGPSLDAEAFCGLGPDPSPVYIGDATLQVQFTARRSLWVDADVIGAVANDAGDQLLQLEHGDGMITVLTTTRMWRNSRIGCHDHAHLLGFLLGRSATTWWLAGVEMPGLPLLLWRHFPYALLGTFLLGALWAWNRMVRFGAVSGQAQVPRRSLLEHVRATAAYYWRHRQEDALLAFMREDILSRTGDPARSPVLAAAAERAGIDHAELEQALAAEPGINRETFLARVRVLQRLRRVL